MKLKTGIFGWRTVRTATLICMGGRSAADLSPNIPDTVNHSRNLSLMVTGVFNVGQHKKKPCVGVLGRTNTNQHKMANSLFQERLGGENIGEQTDRTMAGFETDGVTRTRVNLTPEICDSNHQDRNLTSDSQPSNLLSHQDFKLRPG